MVMVFPIIVLFLLHFFFFFQAEDGIRDYKVTGVQTCALPISFFVRLAEREVFGVAGLWDRSRREDGSYVFSCTLITVPANRMLAEIHNAKQRMPAILAESDHEVWLRGALPGARRALTSFADERMRAWRGRHRVNSPKLPNDASLIEPHEASR